MKKWMALTVFLALFIFASFNATHGTLLNSFIEHYDLETALQGFPAAAQNIGCAIALLLSFRLVRSLGKERVLALALCATALFILPLGFAPSFAWLVCLCGVIGICVGLIDTLASSCIAEMYQGRAGSAMLCLLHAIFGAAGVAMPAITNWAMSAGIAWNHLYFILGGFALATLAYTMPVCLKSHSVELLRRDSSSIRFASVLDFLKNRDRALLLVCMALYVCSLSNAQLWTDRYVKNYLGRADLAALSLSLFWLGLTGSRLSMSFIRISPMTYLRTALPLSGVVLLIGLITGNPWVICILSALASLLSGATLPLILGELCGRYDGNTLIVTTVSLMFVYTAQCLCPLGVGALTTSVGLHTALYPAVVTSLLAGLVAYMVRRTHA